MIGPILNSVGIIAGSIIGAALAKYIPKRLQTGLPPTFALASILIGVNMIVKGQHLPVVILSLIFGTAIGELFYLERSISRGATLLQSKLDRFIPLPRGLTQEEFSKQFASLLVVFGASGLGVIGSMTEGMNGDYQLLLVKAIMDFLTACIFAIGLGAGISFTVIAQLVVQVALFYLAKPIMPYMDAAAFGDFSAVGGIIMVAVGLRIAQIMNFAVVNFLPALFLVLPLTYLWRHFFG
ncbi:DUF554 domain-containing protein [Shewanella avicenniae]|uniref:DUF554 domain-containing protein n=1 Tax=Shewanella avicenniae TaxID=2814294 RepID=A0ABX7QN29_9GAMM|nr:DUF554 domain-containing protein [Shewanella avicenniae]QSX32769.1 DUF554 domain-containing protein [Shewanella avicenniae]